VTTSSVSHAEILFRTIRTSFLIFFRSGPRWAEMGEMNVGCGGNLCGPRSGPRWAEILDEMGKDDFGQRKEEMAKMNLGRILGRE
jgi:hypothetical protein